MNDSMKAVGYTTPGAAHVLKDVELPTPRPGPRDLLVEVRAISVNPVDAKIRSGGGPGGPGGAAKVLGWDTAGIVAAVGGEVTLFTPGDEVYYAGSVDRAGCYSEFHVVDERLVGTKPRTLDFAQAAALPLTTITAWELIFDRLRVGRTLPGAVLVLGGAGGVGSIAIQLLRQLTRQTIVATASRPETVAWCRRMGAHQVIDHAKPVAAQVKALIPEGVNYVLGLTKLEDHYEEVIESMAPQGALGWIENPARPLDIVKLKPKSLSLHAEFMFTRSRFQTPDMGEQGRLLSEVSTLVDAGLLQTTLQTHLGIINADNVARAHALVESGRSIGKVVLAGF